MKKTAAFLCAVILGLACLCGCSAFEREYHDDLVYELEDGESVIIKEWSFLLGSGAEIYFQKGDEEPVLLGKTTGGDDGFCSFKEGLYEITQDGNTISVSWCFNPSNNDPSQWRSESFDLPRE